MEIASTRAISTWYMVRFCLRLILIVVVTGIANNFLAPAILPNTTARAIVGPLVFLALIVPLLWVFIFRVALRRVAAAEALSEKQAVEMRAESRRNEFDSEIRRAFHMARSEELALDVVRRAAPRVVPDAAMELLLADSSEAHLRRVVGVRDAEGQHPECTVGTPFSCPAISDGSSMSFANSRDLDTCPHLQGRRTEDVSATCVPVMFLGQALGVLHTIGTADQPLGPDQNSRLELLAAQTGSNLGMLRAFNKSQVQASTDALTGLSNRRALLDGYRRQRYDHDCNTVLMIDLDHFKMLNDVHGHDVGDRALRLFSRVLRDCTRDGDLVGRYGGEEFVTILPGRTVEAGIVVAERLRTRLSESLVRSATPSFTVSVGIAEGLSAEELDVVIKAADEALFEAKNAGRDRVHVAERNELAASDAHPPAIPSPRSDDAGTAKRDETAAFAASSR
jgi:diguanylate cyclase (GGDEF)-like protein